MSPLLPRFDERFDHLLVHSGQHYSANMDAIFFDQLHLRAPDFTLDAGSRPPGEQTATIMIRFEEVLMQEKPDMVVVQGDTNTALAGALASAKHRQDGVRLAHVEAGMRSFLPMQPEELNRKLIDQMSDLLFVPEERDRQNALREGIGDERIVVAGNTVSESCLRARSLPGGAEILAQLGVDSGRYVLATFHRQETVDTAESLASVCRSLVELSGRIPVVVPLHPRPGKMILAQGVEFNSPGLSIIEPVGYTEMIALLDNCRFLVTDSGGLQEEAAVLGVSAIVLRERTEHTAYVDSGLHRLVGTDARRFREAVEALVDHSQKPVRKPHPRTKDVHSSDIIVQSIARRGATAVRMELS